MLTLYAQEITELTVTLTSTRGVNYLSILYVSHSLLPKQDNALSEFEPVRLVRRLYDDTTTLCGKALVFRGLSFR